MRGLQEIFKNYNDMIQEISILEEQIYLTEKERDSWWIGGHRFHRVPMDNAAERVDKLNEKLDKMRERLTELRESKRRINSMMAHFEGIEYKVAYKRLVEGKKLEEIAKELNYSVDWIKRVSARITKEYTDRTLMGL